MCARKHFAVLSLGSTPLLFTTSEKEGQVQGNLPYQVQRNEEQVPEGDGFSSIAGPSDSNTERDEAQRDACNPSRKRRAPEDEE